MPPVVVASVVACERIYSRKSKILVVCCGGLVGLYSQQASDPAIGYPFPARQHCRAWTLDSLAYYYEKRGKHRGAHSYLQKAFQALAVSDDQAVETSPFRGVDILLHTGYVAAKVRKKWQRLHDNCSWPPQILDAYLVVWMSDMICVRVLNT